MENDPFSDILMLAKVQPMITGGFTAGGAWALRFPKPDRFKFFALIKGQCWLGIEGIKEAIRIGEGDVFLIAAQKPFILASNMDVPPIDAVALFADKPDKTARIGTSEDCIQIGGHVRLNSTGGELLEYILPPFIHVKASSNRAEPLKVLLGQLVHERKNKLPGEKLVSSHLAQLLFINILRVYMDSNCPLPTGWLRGVSDKQLSPALRMIHGDPGHNWKLSELAKQSAMSRTAFAAYFKSVIGSTPIAYLTQWRMNLAKKTLAEEETSIGVIANLIGYSSDSAFSSAFKRVTGMAPKHYREEIRSRYPG